MATITTRVQGAAPKGSPLTNVEVDDNFLNLNADKLEKSGGAMTGDLEFGDGKKALFGTGDDLQIYHDGSNSRVQDTGTGGLRLMGSEFVALQSNDGENMVVGSNNGAVTLYYDHAPKLATTSTGIDVTGTITADGLDISGALYPVKVVGGGSTNEYGNYIYISGDNGQDQRAVRIAAVYRQGEVKFAIDVSSDSQTYGADPALLSYTNAQTIDSSGIVTMPRQPAFYANLSAHWTAQGTMTFGNTKLNDPAWNGVGFTAPVAGKYKFSWGGIGLDVGAGGGGTARMNVAVNGVSNFGAEARADVSQDFDPASSTVILQLQANDYVTITNSDTRGWYTDYTHFSGYLIG